MFRKESRFTINQIIENNRTGCPTTNLAILIFNPQLVIRHIDVSMKFHDLYLKCIPAKMYTYELS